MYGISGFVDNTLQLNEAHLKGIPYPASPGTSTTQALYIENSNFHAGFISRDAGHTGKTAEEALPISSICGRYSLILHGAIYNKVALRETLIKYGVTFKTLSDGEVVMACYIKWGLQFFDQLEGAYSFVLLDRRQNQFLIARDATGAKPLFFYQKAHCYAFATEIKSLLAYPNIERTLSYPALRTFLQEGYFIGPDTIYQHIKQFEKGTYTVIDLHSGNLYSAPLGVTMDKKKEIPASSDHNLIDRVEELLTESIVQKNTAVSSVGARLTDGYNSAVLAALWQKNTSKRLKTCAIRIEKLVPEASDAAKKVSEHLKTNHQEFFLREKDATSLLEGLPHVFGMPVGDSHILFSLFEAQQLKGEIDVFLGSASADSLFGGDPAYLKTIQWRQLPDQVPALLRKPFLSLLRLAPARIQETIKAPDLLSAYIQYRAGFTPAELDRLLTQPQIAVSENPGGNKSIKDLMAYDFNHRLPDQRLYQQDHAFRYAGIEHRDAYLNLDLAAYLLKLRSPWFLQRQELKPLLKKIGKRYIAPAAIYEQPHQALAINSWLTSVFKPYIAHYLSPEQLRRHELFNIKEVNRIKETFYRNSSPENSRKIWLLLAFQCWYDRWIY